MKKGIVVGAVLLFCVAVISVFRPVPIVSESESKVERGVVIAIHEGGECDVVIELKNNPCRFYINRGVEAGLDISDLQMKILGNEIVLKYPKYWTPLDWNNSTKHISKLEFNGEILFNELKE